MILEMKMSKIINKELVVPLTRGETGSRGETGEEGGPLCFPFPERGDPTSLNDEEFRGDSLDCGDGLEA